MFREETTGTICRAYRALKSQSHYVNCSATACLNTLRTEYVLVYDNSWGLVRHEKEIERLERTIMRSTDRKTEFCSMSHVWDQLLLLYQARAVSASRAVNSRRNVVAAHRILEPLGGL